MDSSGNLYGTASIGGVNCGTVTIGCGVVFEATPTGSELVLYTFQGGNDGAIPEAGLIADQSGNFYGTTVSGGGCAALQGTCGTVFKLAPGGTETVLYAFQGDTDGARPEAGLVMDQAGNLYGTTYEGGQNATCDKATLGCGIVFKVAPGGSETELYRFNQYHGGPINGANPVAPLLLGNKGVLYGTASEGGRQNDGVVFSVTTE